MRAAPALLLALALGGCTRDREEKAPPLSELKPRPLPSLADAPPPPATDLGAAFRVEAVEVYGHPLPEGAVRVELRGEAATVGGAPLDPATLPGLAAKKSPVLLVPDGETFLAQAAGLFARLDDAGLEVYLLHPEGKVAFPLTLSDEKDFQTWLDDQRSFQGRIRVIHRADGYEVQTNLGKVLGYDPNGPSVPLRGGQWDLSRLRTALQRLRDRFEDDEAACIVPSFGMELSSVARSLTGFYEGPEEPFFGDLCLVYPRPS